MGPNGLRRDVQLVLWKPCRLVKDEVTEWSAPVQELRRRCEGLGRWNDPGDIRFRFVPVSDCGESRRT